MLYDLQSMYKPTCTQALKSIETSLPCTSQKSSRPRQGRFGGSGWLVCYTLLHMHACASISIDCTGLVPLFDFSLQPIESNFRRLCDFTRKCRTSRKTLLSRRLINLEQAQRRTLAYERPVFRLF